MRFFKFGLFIALGAMMSSCVFTEEPEIEFPAEMCIEASGITASTATSYTSWLEVRHLNRKHVFETDLAYVTATDSLLSTDIRREKSALFSTATEETLLDCRTEGNIATEKQRTDYIFKFATFSVPVSFITEKASVLCNGQKLPMPAAEVRFLPQDPEFVSLEDEIIDGKPFSRTLLKCSVVAESEGRTVTAVSKVEIKSPREAIGFDPIVLPWEGDAD